MNRNLTPKYFREQMLEFDKMKGNKKYWKLSADKINTKIDLAFKGLFHIYLKTDGLTEEDKLYMQALSFEFSQRKILMEIYNSEV